MVALESWLNTLTPWARAHEEGEIVDLFDAAAHGEIWDTGDPTTSIKPIHMDPEIFELRHTSLSKKLRFYHGEPTESPRDLIALHRHIKTGADSQQDEITYAARRYAEGRPNSWQRLHRI